ncbi:MAG: SDR family oxidoreductase [Desulforhopalus sp.]|nr:SDR family oxidoreductase [Desulforhopalus sp.]
MGIPFDFTGKRALVTGATRGIGRAVAENLLAAGADVIGIYASNTEAAEKFKKESPCPDRLQMHQCDVSDEKQVAAFYRKLEDSGEHLHILVNCAGIRRDSVLAMMKPANWQRVLDINLTGTFLMSRGAVPLMMSSRFGRIISISSPVARMGFAGQSNYAASKAGQIAMSKSLAKEVGRKKITVNCVAPGFINTDFIADLPEEQVKAYKKMVPMRRFGEVQEVADAVLFLASDYAAYISGTVLEIAGGL